MTSAPESGAPWGLSERTLQNYAANWALFTDWCEVTERCSLPAAPETLLAFFQDCPAKLGTHRARTAAIDHQHTAIGYAPPGKSPAVLAALGRRVPGPYEPTPKTVAAVDAALRLLPSHGWTTGMFGRRDRCLLVLSQLAGVHYRHLSAVTAGDITLLNGTATIATAGRSWSMNPSDDPVVCGPCAVVRWLRILDLATRGSTSSVAAVLGKASAVTKDSPHLCRSTRLINPGTRGAPVLTPVNQWGALPLAETRSLTPHSQSLRTRAFLAGDFGVHRELSFPSDDPPVAPPVPTAAPPPRYDRSAADSARAKRRNDLTRLADVGDTLTDVDRQIAELQLRVTALLGNQLS